MIRKILNKMFSGMPAAFDVERDAIACEMPEGWENPVHAGVTDEVYWENMIGLWANDRDLIKGSSPTSQMLKLIEEVAELAEAIRKGDDSLAEDAIGDVSVVLCIIAHQLGLGYNDCLWEAYGQIKDRKGKMINGVFVKEEDLKDED